MLKQAIVLLSISLIPQLLLNIFVKDFSGMAWGFGLSVGVLFEVWNRLLEKKRLRYLAADIERAHANQKNVLQCLQCRKLNKARSK